MAKTPAKTSQSTALAEPDIDLYADAGMGSENIGQSDVVIPRIQIAQALSPELKKTKPEYIEGSEEGTVFNTATRQVYETPLMIVPVAYNRRFIEWVPRADGGGLVNPDHSEEILEQTTKDDRGRNRLPNGNEVVDTPEHFVLVLHPGGMAERAVLSMQGTKAKISRQWNTLITGLRIQNPKTGAMINPARFYGTYEFDVVPDSNDQGDWMNWKVKYAGPLLEREGGGRVYLEAREFHKMVRAGEVQAEVEQPGGAAEGASDTEAF